MSSNDQSVALASTAIVMSYVPDNDELIEACWEGDLEEVEHLVKQLGADVSYRNAAGRTPLVYACLGGNLEIVQFLVQSGAEASSEAMQTVKEGKKEDILAFLSESVGSNEKTAGGLPEEDTEDGTVRDDGTILLASSSELGANGSMPPNQIETLRPASPSLATKYIESIVSNVVKDSLDEAKQEIKTTIEQMISSCLRSQAAHSNALLQRTVIELTMSCDERICLQEKELETLRALVREQTALTQAQRAMIDDLQHHNDAQATVENVLGNLSLDRS